MNAQVVDGKKQDIIVPSRMYEDSMTEFVVETVKMIWITNSLMC